MSNEEVIEYKPRYTLIFAINYLMQGLVISTFAVIIPVFAIRYMGTIDAAELAFLATIIASPTLFKLLYGILTDKYGTKHLGRRKPWVLSAGILSGLLFILFPLLITPSNFILVVTFLGFLIFVSMYMIDTSVDGFILDICPKEQLGRTQGYCFGTRAIGTITGGPIFLYLVVIIEVLTVPLIFILLGIFLIIVAFLILVIKAATVYPEVKLGLHLKSMFNNRRDWKVYLFSIFYSLLNQVIFIFLSIYVLIQMGIIEFEPGGSLRSGGPESNIYIYQANISLLTSGGIILGSLVGGRISDLLSRRISVYLASLASTITILLILIDVNLIGMGVLLFFVATVGFAMGLRYASSTAVQGQLSKKHPEMIGTYFAIVMSFSNLGLVLGLFLTGIIFGMTASFFVVFLFLAIMQNIGLIFFSLLNPKEYEPKLSEAE